MNETLAILTVFIVGALVPFGIALYYAWRTRQLSRRLDLCDRHLRHVTRQAYTVAQAHHWVRNNGSARDRLALDRAVAELVDVADSARGLEPPP